MPRIEQKLEARAALAAAPATMPADERAALRRRAAGDDVVLVMLEQYAPLWLAGMLGAGIMAAVMASDSQILALSTMFTEDVFAFYGGKARFGEAVQVQTGRLFVVLLTVLAYSIALRAPQSIFDLAVQYAFSGYAALSPLLFAALFWKRSTKWGALRGRAVGRVRRDLHRARPRRAGLVRPHAGRADDADLGALMVVVSLVTPAAVAGDDRAVQICDRPSTLLVGTPLTRHRRLQTVARSDRPQRSGLRTSSSEPAELAWLTAEMRVSTPPGRSPGAAASNGRGLNVPVHCSAASVRELRQRLVVDAAVAQRQRQPAGRARSSSRRASASAASSSRARRRGVPSSAA